MTGLDVEDINDSTVKLVRNMERFVFGNTIGLAAPQIGVRRNIFVWKLPGEQTQHILNPRIVDNNGAMSYDEEGCLSYPGYSFLVPRIEKVTIEGINLDGKTVVYEAGDLKSRLFQHEYDHLIGITAPMRAVQTRRLDGN